MDKFGAREVASGRKRLAIVLAPDLCHRRSRTGHLQNGDNYPTVEHKDAFARDPKNGGTCRESEYILPSRGSPCGLWCRSLVPLQR